MALSPFRIPDHKAKVEVQQAAHGKQENNPIGCVRDEGIRRVSTVCGMVRFTHRRRNPGHEF